MKSLILILIFVTISVKADYSEKVNKFLENGFHHIGTYRESINGVIGVTSSFENDLFSSPDTVDQMGALRGCRILGGRLLSILTFNQDEGVRAAISSYDQSLGDQFWTSGTYDPEDQIWYWASSNNYVIGPNSHQRWLANCRTEAFGYGIIVQGRLNRYGWCSALSNTRLPYICVA